jgi:hypothetical protein
MEMSYALASNAKLLLLPLPHHSYKQRKKNYLKINRILVKEGASRLSFMVDTSPMSRVINRTMTVLFDGLVPRNQLNSFSESIFDGRARTN